ncbi:flavin reductase family protein [Pelagibacterium halotolerans]|uniref:Flavin reductase domain protein, FMN-binding protein n=1 Tax=Pelagibacterium halotolerans (strain DSM 22347 / JCM 15775 / CGMCC 1.7692 / B2) TaxID=1082931 RepID=G4REP0_PELHB|nr:flavin reductase family protein [Pelagibacterium halotolerans]AEQ50890.1 flavin reductase domain protein, FMN-binding protein [Pelagibacterium halotolerans B2]QJR19204.1 flavin reductase [Pelagibacterium halotolerans]SDZ99103.1 flavin reductase [Pelagibacterium halotolerans]
MSALPRFATADDNTGLEADFRAGMSKLVSGVSIIASGSLENPVGLVATSVTSLTLDPPSLLVCVSQTASARNAIVATRAVSVNILASTDQAIAEPFASAALKAERFRRGNWSALQTGVPTLDSALAVFDCTISQHIPYSTHIILIAQAQAVRLAPSPAAPLIHFDRAMRPLP